MDFLCRILFKGEVMQIKSIARITKLVLSLILIAFITFGCSSGGSGSGNGVAVDDGNVDNDDNTTYEPEPSLSEMPNGERILFVKRFTVSNTAL
jgi:hypothetical protein